MKAELTYKEYSQKQRASNMWWTGFITMILGFFSIIISLLYVNTRIVKYHYITENIEIKDVSFEQLYTMCSLEDGVWYNTWFMSFEGKYDSKKATVSLYPEMMDYTLMPNDDNGDNVNAWVVDLYAIATIKNADYFNIYIEYVFTFIYW